MNALWIGIYYNKTTPSIAPHILKSYVGGRVLHFSLIEETPKMIVDTINCQHPSIVGFSAYIWNASLIKDILPFIEKDIFKIVGGRQVIGIEEDFLKAGADSVVSGEAEQVIENVCNNRIRGIVYGEEAILNNVPDIYEEILQTNYTWAVLETSRGCPFKCGYCVWSGSRNMRYYSLESVLKQLDKLLSSNLKRIYICDSSLLFNKSRAKTILNFCKKYDKPIRFEFMLEQLDDEFLDILGNMPKTEYCFGIQTINSEALKVLGRVFDREKFERAYLALCHKHSIKIDAIYGLPGDTLEGYQRTLDYFSSLPNIYWIMTYPFLLLPGSPFWKDKEKYGIKFDKDSFLVTETNSWSSEDMQQAWDYSAKINRKIGLRHHPSLIASAK